VNAVNRVLAIAAASLLLCFAPVFSQAQSDATGMRAQFEAVIDGLNNNSFSEFHAAVDDDAFLGRIFGTRVIEDDAKRALAADFTNYLESAFTDAFPSSRDTDQAGTEITGTIVSFNEQGGQAQAIVRFEAEGFRFVYQAYDLVRRSGGGLQIVDWFDYYQVTWFSELIGNQLVRALPSQAAVASLLELPNPTEGQLFQVGELMKSIRDRNPQRYFQIHGGLEEALRKEPFIVITNFRFCRVLGDPRRLESAIDEVVANFPGDARFSLGLAEFYVRRRLFEDAINELDAFADLLGMTDGVIESLKATAAMALGDFERAQAFALAATDAEAGLELGWWTMLRTRTAAGNYAGATEALTQLEDRFGHLLIPQKLQRDRFLKVLIDQEEYKKWREARDQA
jgi:hypothetical protein